MSESLPAIRTLGELRVNPDPRRSNGSGLGAGRRKKRA
jgi:hypothetical protein